MSDDVKKFFTGAAAETVPRDRWGRPLIKPLDGGKSVAYQRVTTFVGPLEDTSNLTKWKQRQTMIGLMKRPALQMAVAAAGDDSRKLNALADECMEAAGSGDKATLGTAIHNFTENYDNGLDISGMPPAYVPDIQAYAAATAQFEKVAVEQFLVIDELKVAGTTDRMFRFIGGDGQIYIGDVKTGSIEYGQGKIAMQLACYSRGKGYDPETGERLDLGNVNQQAGIIIHLPAGTGTCTLYWVNLAAGWDACVNLAVGVQAHRKRKDWLAPFDAPAQAEGQQVLELPVPAPQGIPSGVDLGTQSRAIATQPVAETLPPQNMPGNQAGYTALAGEIDAALLQAINGAIDTNTLTVLWNLNRPVWEAHHTAAAKARAESFGASQ